MGRILGVDPAFDGMPGEADRLAERERPAQRNQDLLLDQVDPGDLLGHGMLHLDAGIHLQEVELAVLVQEFDRPSIDVAHLAR